MIAVAHLHHPSSVLIAAVQVVNPLSPAKRLFGQTESCQYGEPGRLQQKDCTDRTRHRRLFIDAVQVTLSTKKKRRGLAGGAISHNRDA